MFTWVEISKTAIEHNILEFRKLIGKDRLLMPVIKANAYGHGFLCVAKICDRNKNVDRICVVNSDEAINLLEAGIKKTIMILSFYDLDQKTVSKLVKSNVIFPVYDLKQANFLNKIGEQKGKIVKVHIKIDTGTSRVGILPNELGVFAKKIAKLKNIEIEGMWSHFASSENDKKYTQKQNNIFNESFLTLSKEGIRPAYKHMSCSAASVSHSLDSFNAVRIGLSLYGLYPNEESKNKIKLKSALSLYTKIIQIKNLPSGTKIGYGGTYTTKEMTKLAILPIGYWDGYDRRFSNKATVIVKGQKCAVRGSICMNLCMVDVKGVPNVKVGDKVTIIGQDKRESITVDDLASIAGTINYEIVDRINPLLPRVLV